MALNVAVVLIDRISTSWLSTSDAGQHSTRRAIGSSHWLTNCKWKTYGLKFESFGVVTGSKQTLGQGVFRSIHVGNASMDQLLCISLCPTVPVLEAIADGFESSHYFWAISYCLTLTLPPSGLISLKYFKGEIAVENSPNSPINII